MSKNKALVITDGNAMIDFIAKTIDTILNDRFKVKIVEADKFEGTDLLESEVFFIGCADANPASFAYLEDMLAHINLASRKCGLFTIKSKTIKYLKDMIKDSEAEAVDLYIPKDEISRAAIKKWLKGITK